MGKKACTQCVHIHSKRVIRPKSCCAAQVRSCDRDFACKHSARSARVDDLSALLACTGSHLNGVVGRLDDVGVVLNDVDRAASLHHLLNESDEPSHVFQVQAVGGPELLSPFAGFSLLLHRILLLPPIELYRPSFLIVS